MALDYPPYQFFYVADNINRRRSWRMYSVPDPGNIQICNWLPWLYSTKPLILCSLLPGVTRKYHQSTWQERIWIWRPSMPFQWPVPLAGVRAGILSLWSSWCPDKLGPTFSRCCNLYLSENTCYATWRSQSRSNVWLGGALTPKQTQGDNGEIIDCYRFIFRHVEACQFFLVFDYLCQILVTLQPLLDMG